jgi:hypothetical protein
MNVSKGIILTCFLVLALSWGTPIGLSFADEAGILRAPEPKEVPKKPKGPPKNSAPSRLFQTLKVAGKSTYVYLKASKRSRRFGPLVNGEKVKKLDAYGNWVSVWIPRLLISGWVHRTTVKSTRSAGTDDGYIPLDFVTFLRVTGTRANIRKWPNTRSSIIMQARKNQELWLLDEQKGWFQVGIPKWKKKGWVYGTLVSKKHKK